MSVNVKQHNQFSLEVDWVELHIKHGISLFSSVGYFNLFFTLFSIFWNSFSSVGVSLFLRTRYIFFLYALFVWLFFLWIIIFLLKIFLFYNCFLLFLYFCCQFSVQSLSLYVVLNRSPLCPTHKIHNLLLLFSLPIYVLEKRKIQVWYGPNTMK